MEFLFPHETPSSLDLEHLEMMQKKLYQQWIEERDPANKLQLAHQLGMYEGAIMVYKRNAIDHASLKPLASKYTPTQERFIKDSSRNIPVYTDTPVRKVSENDKKRIEEVLKRKYGDILSIPFYVSQVIKAVEYGFLMRDMEKRIRTIQESITVAITLIGKNKFEWRE